MMLRSKSIKTSSQIFLLGWLLFPALLKGFVPAADSVLIASCKSFFFKEIGIELKGDFYTHWKKTDSPYLCLFVSENKDVKCPKSVHSAYSFVYCGNDSDCCREIEKFTAKGYHTFVYRTYANSACLLNKRFLSYTPEAKSFIIFHELMHNYIAEKNNSILYEYNEAACDVIGNYLADKFAREYGITSIELVNKQTRVNENLYKKFNIYIRRIHLYPVMRHSVYRHCEKNVRKLLREGDTFQHDRFNYKVNNAYLLKNSNYCKRYFLLKKLYLSCRSTQEFLDKLYELPDTKYAPIPMGIFKFGTPDTLKK